MRRIAKLYYVLKNDRLLNYINVFDIEYIDNETYKSLSSPKIIKFIKQNVEYARIDLIENNYLLLQNNDTNNFDWQNLLEYDAKSFYYQLIKNRNNIRKEDLLNFFSVLINKYYRSESTIVAVYILLLLRFIMKFIPNNNDLIKLIKDIIKKEDLIMKLYPLYITEEHLLPLIRELILNCWNIVAAKIALQILNLSTEELIELINSDKIVKQFVEDNLSIKQYEIYRKYLPPVPAFFKFDRCIIHYNGLILKEFLNSF